MFSPTCFTRSRPSALTVAVPIYITGRIVMQFAVNVEGGPDGTKKVGKRVKGRGVSGGKI